MSFLEVEELWVRYGSFTAVRNVSFEIAKGEVFGFIGPNGAGKTTTIKVLATLLKPTAGVVRIGGLDILREPGKVRRRLGYVPDFFGVYEDLTVYEYLHFFAAAYHIEKPRRKSLISDMLESPNLPINANRRSTPSPAA